MKKLLSILLAAMLLLSLAACGGKDDGDAADKLQGALGGVSEPASSAPTQADGTLLETEFWSVTYPEDWVYSEEDDMGISEGYYAYVTLHIPQEDDPESDTLLLGFGRGALRLQRMSVYTGSAGAFVPALPVKVDCTQFTGRLRCNFPSDCLLCLHKEDYYAEILLPRHTDLEGRIPFFTL